MARAPRRAPVRRAHRTGWLVAALPCEALAHAFGQRYDLPLPLAQYIIAAGGVVALSFLVVVLFAARLAARAEYPRYDLRQTAIGRRLSSPHAVALARILGVAVLLGLLLAGFFGVQNPYRNIVPTAIWILGWIGLAYVCALAGDVWALVNPFRALYRGIELAWRGFARRELSLGWRPPPWLGAWPAVALLIGFSWVEIVWPGNEVPADLAALLLGYTVLTLAGMHLFGREAWLARGEVFSLFFGLFARFAPTEVRVRSAECCAACSRSACREEPGDCVQCHECLARASPGQWQWNLRPWAAGLVARRPLDSSMTVLACVALAAVTFDGVRETPFWEHVMIWVFHPLQPVAGATARLTLSAGLALTIALFLAAYAGCCAAMAAWVRRRSRQISGTGDRWLGAWTLARLFVLSLMPIAIAYHLAHYLHYLLVAGQFAIPLASDPLGAGWNLFGSAGFRADPALVGARFSWYASLAAIVTGHVIAMYVAHATALQFFRDRRLALASQYPLAVLMVAYTMLSLWILAQPVVEQVPLG